MTPLTPSERTEIANAILGNDFRREVIWGHLAHWDAFVPYPMSFIEDGDHVPDHMWACYCELRDHAHRWLTGRRLLDLETRLEALEGRDGGQLSDYR